MCDHLNKFKNQRECSDCLAACESYRSAIRKIPAAIGAGERWTTSITIHRYLCGTHEVFIQNWDTAAAGSENERPYTLAMTPDIEAAYNAAIDAANAALRLASGEPGDRVRAMGWRESKKTYAQILQTRRLAALARKRKAVAAVKAQIERLYDSEGCKWEFAVATALKGSKLPRKIKDEIAETEEWPRWIEAYA